MLRAIIMNPIGTHLKNLREQKGFTLDSLASATRIKRSYIELIETQKWESLPDYPVVLGFVKRIASELGMSESTATALLRRDYPPKHLSMNPKPDISKKFVWGPVHTMIVIVSLFVSAILVYLTFQYVTFTRPPFLEITNPPENAEITTRIISITGKTNPDVSVRVNNQPALVDEEGNFQTEIEISKDTEELLFSAKSRAGRETVVRRRIQVISE